MPGRKYTQVSSVLSKPQVSTSSFRITIRVGPGHDQIPGTGHTGCFLLLNNFFETRDFTPRPTLSPRLSNFLLGKYFSTHETTNKPAEDGELSRSRWFKLFRAMLFGGEGKG